MIADTRGRNRPERARRPGGLSMRPILPVLLLATSLLAAPPSQGQVPLTILLKDALSFEPASFRVEPGENVSLRLVHDGVTEHTFTLFAQADATVPLTDFSALRAYNDSNAKIVEVGLLGGEEREVQFTAPSLNGTYTFVCMVAGHSAGGMHGVMTVGGASGDGVFRIGIVQALLLIALVGTVIFALIYQIRSMRQR